MTTLYEITAQYREDLAKIQDLDLPPEVVMDTIEAMQADFETKVRAVLGYTLELEAIADKKRDAAKSMMEGAKALENRAESLRSYVQAMIQGAGVKLPLKLPEFNVNLAKNPPSCEVTDVSKLAPFLVKTHIGIEISGAITTDYIDAIRAHIESVIGRTVVLDVDVTPNKRELLDSLKTLQAGDTLPGAKLNPTSFRLTVK